MKRLAFLLMVVVASPQAKGEGVSEEVDKFTGERKITYVSGAAAEIAKPKFFIRATAGSINAVVFMYTPALGRYAVQDGMKFIGCKNIDWLVDGRPTKLGIVVHDFKRMDRLMLEFLNQEVSTEQLAAIGNASTVEYRLCGSVEGSLSEADISAAKEIAARLSET